MHHPIDISEDHIFQRSPELLKTLLKDHTMSRKKEQDWNIFWATSDYEHLGEGFQYADTIMPENITGKYGNVIQPRTCKDRLTQISRSRDKAEVFTPSWICNAQNNLIDNAWFGREGVFNTENPDHTWTVNTEPITFPEGKTWKDYVRDTRLEITCGEAPYLASRYDTALSGQYPILPWTIANTGRWNNGSNVTPFLITHILFSKYEYIPQSIIRFGNINCQLH